MTNHCDALVKITRSDLLRVRPEFTATEVRPLNDAAMRAAAPDGVIHLAAPAGVGWSIENPRADVETDIGATFTMMKATRQVGPITCGWPRPVQTVAPVRRCPSKPPPLRRPWRWAMPWPHIHGGPVAMFRTVWPLEPAGHGAAYDHQPDPGRAAYRRP